MINDSVTTALSGSMNRRRVWTRVSGLGLSAGAALLLAGTVGNASACPDTGVAVRVAPWRTMTGTAEMASVSVGASANAGPGDVVAWSAAPTPPAPPTPPEPARARGEGSNSIITSSDGGKTTKIEIKDGVVTSVEIDGKPIPLSQVRRRNDTVVVTDEKGNTLSEHSVPDWAPKDRWAVRTFARGGATAGSPGGSARVLTFGPDEDGPGALAGITRVVMIGIQMAEPDSSLRGHLGLDEGKTTMVTGVHEGLPASAAGLNPYDIIVAINGDTNASLENIGRVIQSKQPGETVVLSVIQKGVKHDVTVTLEKFDGVKMENAKVRAIAESDAGMAFFGSGPGAFGESFKKNFGITGEQMRMFGDRAQVWSEEAQRQAEELADRMREKAERLGEEANRFSEEASSRIEERMQKLESMLERMAEEMRAAEKRGEPAPPPAPPAPANPPKQDTPKPGQT